MENNTPTGEITITVNAEEKKLLEEMLYHEYLACMTTGRMKQCEGILRKLGFKFPGFDFLVDKGGRKQKMKSK